MFTPDLASLPIQAKMGPKPELARAATIVEKFEKEQHHMLEDVWEDLDFTIKEEEGKEPEVIQKKAEKKGEGFFASIEFAKDDGWTEVRELWNKSRWFWAAYGAFMLFLNVKTLIETQVPDLFKKWTIEPGTKTQFLLGPAILDLITPVDFKFDPQVVLSVLELMALFILTSAGIKHVFFAFSTNKESTRWWSISRLFFVVVPEMTTLSGMSLLKFVAPSVLIGEIKQNIIYIFEMKEKREQHRQEGDDEKTKSANKKVQYARVNMWMHVFKAVGCFIIGFDAFLLKFREAAVFADIPLASGENSASYLGMLAFLNQMLGILDVNKFAIDRMFLYVFGGEDCAMSQHEALKVQVWHGMLAREMWRCESKKEGPAALRFGALMMSYTHFDFQKLTLNTPDKKKSVKTE